MNSGTETRELVAISFRFEKVLELSPVKYLCPEASINKNFTNHLEDNKIND